MLAFSELVVQVWVELQGSPSLQGWAEAVLHQPGDQPLLQAGCGVTQARTVVSEDLAQHGVLLLGWTYSLEVGDLLQVKLTVGVERVPQAEPLVVTVDVGGC